MKCRSLTGFIRVSTRHLNPFSEPTRCLHWEHLHTWPLSPPCPSSHVSPSLGSCIDCFFRWTHLKVRSQEATERARDTSPFGCAENANASHRAERRMCEDEQTCRKARRNKGTKMQESGPNEIFAIDTQNFTLNFGVCTKIISLFTLGSPRVLGRCRWGMTGVMSGWWGKHCYVIIGVGGDGY